MLDDDDQFYKTLPFTLTADQAKPNFVILGTGLQECLIAAHYSKMHSKPGLILDIDRAYGGCLKTVVIKELIALSKKKISINCYQFLILPEFEERNEKYYTNIIENKTYKGYNIDLEPNFFFGSSVSCDLLKEADMDKYMDFRLVYSMLHYDGKGLKNVPLSKGKIFQSKDLGLLEKKLLLSTFHSLIQIYNKFMNVEEDQNSTKQFDKQFGQVDEKLYAEFLSNKEQSFIPFLSKLTKNNTKIMNFIIYILCNYQYNYKKQVPQHIKNQYTLQSFIHRFGKFVKSCGIYGQGPYLYVDNGIGDVPQAYSRIASIYQSTYILHPKIEIRKIEAGQTIKIYTNLYPEGYIETQELFYGPTCYNLKYAAHTQYRQEFTLRTIFLCTKLGNEEECPGIAYLLDLQTCQNPVYLFMLDSVSHSCPQGMILYQFQTVINDKKEEVCLAKVKIFLQTLKIIRGQNFEQSILFATAYLRQKRYPKQMNVQGQNKAHERVLRDHSGIDLDSHFINFKEVVGQQQSYFKKEKAQHEQQQDWNQDQTVDLIEKLQSIDIHKEKVKGEQQEVKQGKQQEKQEGSHTKNEKEEENVAQNNTNQEKTSQSETQNQQK